MSSDTSAGTAAEESGILARDDGPSIAYYRRLGRSDLPGVVFLPGFRSTMASDKANAVDQFCAAREQALVRFDYSGHGASEGVFEDGTIGAWLADSLDVIDRLTWGPQILVGSSMGGWLSLLAASVRPRIAGLVLIAPATDFTEALAWERMTEAQQQQLVSEGGLDVPSVYEPTGYRLTRGLIEEGRRHMLLDAPIPFAGPVRIFHGMADPDVPWQHSLKLIDALTSTDVTLTAIKGAGHRLGEPGDLTRMLGAVEELSAPPL